MEDSIYSTHGNFRELLSYQKSDIIFQGTWFFCHHYLERGDRTIDQMIQAARSCKQNIVEGCAASMVSTETEIRLTGVAKASLLELEEDYRDYLTTRNLPLWPKRSKPVEAVRKLGRLPDESYETYRALIEQRSPGTVANIMFCLCCQCDCLLLRQMRGLEKKFLAEGGIREKMTRLRKENKDKDGGKGKGKKP